MNTYKTAEGVNGGIGAAHGAEGDTNVAPRGNSIIEIGPNASLTRPLQARGLKNMGNTRFLNASLLCLMVVREFGEARAQQPGQRKMIQSQLVQHIGARAGILW